MNSALRMLLAAMMRARWLGWRAHLDQRVHRHAVEAGEQRQQDQVGHHAPVRACSARKPPRRVAGRRRQAARREVEVDREHAHADRAERHQADLDMAARQHFAQQRADADADREHHQQQRRDLLVAVQHLLGEGRELGQEHGAEEPHPRDAEQRAEHDQVAVRELEVAPGLADRVPVDDQARVGRRATAARPAPTTRPSDGDADAGEGDVVRGRPRARATSRPPATLPSRMATKVPISTMPLPPVSSRSLRCCGR